MTPTSGQTYSTVSSALPQVWRNDVTAVEELLEAGGNHDLQDEESGW